jgi:hypothetical protein
MPEDVADDTARTTRPPMRRWYIEHFDAGAWQRMSSPRASRDTAVAQLETVRDLRPLWADGTPVQRRLICETTTYTVDPA